MPKLSIILLLLFTSCSAITDNMLGTGSFSNSDNFFERFPDNKKAVVIMKYSASARRGPIFWCKVANVKEEIKDVKDCRKIQPSDSYQMLMFEPGIYKMAKYNVRKDDYIFGNPQKVFSTDTSLILQVNSQEVVYVGMLKKMGSRYLVSDEFDSIKRPFDTKNYQKLSALFLNPFKEVEVVVAGYHKISKPMVNRLASKIDDIETSEIKEVKKEKSLTQNSCVKTCPETVVRKIRSREIRVKMDKDKFSKKYYKELLDKLNLDKASCGLK